MMFVSLMRSNDWSHVCFLLKSLQKYCKTFLWVIILCTKKEITFLLKSFRAIKERLINATKLYMFIQRIVTGGNYRYHKHFRSWTVILTGVNVVDDVVGRWNYSNMNDRVRTCGSDHTPAQKVVVLEEILMFPSPFLVLYLGFAQFKV